MMLSRRMALGQIVTGVPLLAAGSISVSIGASAQAMTKPVADSKYTLNLVLHGMAVVVVPNRFTASASDGIQILIPDYSGHQHLFGYWCQETQMTKGMIYEITGLDLRLPIDVEDLFPDQNAVLEQSPLVTMGSSSVPLFCTVKLPFPDRIRCMRSVCQTPYNVPFLKNSASNYLRRSPSTIAMVHVFQFSFSDPTQVLFGGQKIKIGDGQTSVNLHLWSDPVEGHHPIENSVMDAAGKTWSRKATPFEMMVKAFTGLACEQSDEYCDRSGVLDPTDVIPGVTHCEKYNLAERGYPQCNDPQCTQAPITHKCPESWLTHTKIVHCMALFVYNGQA